MHLAIKLSQHPKSTESEKKFLEHLGSLAESAVYAARYYMPKRQVANPAVL
jgi:hypothetical protein